MKRKYTFEKPDHKNCYRMFLIEAAHSRFLHRAHCSVVQHRKATNEISFNRCCADWDQFNQEHMKEMNEIEAICLRVADKWLEQLNEV